MTDSWGRSFVYSLLLFPDGQRGFTALADGTDLVWDLSPALPGTEAVAKAPSSKEMAGWWADLAAEDARRAYHAVWRLAEVPHDTIVSYLRSRLKPVGDIDFKKMRDLIEDLDSDSFEVREKAFRQLEELGSAAVPALREALEKRPPSAEASRRLEKLLSRPEGLMIAPETLRHLRAMQILERLASKEAHTLLTELSKGTVHAPETQEAKAALQRLSH
jgi:hypothetical protein